MAADPMMAHIAVMQAMGIGVSSAGRGYRGLQPKRGDEDQHGDAYGNEGLGVRRSIHLWTLPGRRVPAICSEPGLPSDA